MPEKVALQRLRRQSELLLIRHETGRLERESMSSAPGIVAALLVALALTGCTADDGEPPESHAPVVQLAPPGGTNRELSDDEAAGLTDPEHTSADVGFVQAMLQHHAQALEMTAMVESRSRSDDLPLLAERMDVGQRAEIEQMQAWLRSRGEPVVDLAATDGHGHGAAGTMPGMLTEAQVEHLGAAHGEAFDELFLQYMIAHHEGALLMVSDLLTAGSGGQEPEVFQIAQHVDSDQRVEISRMRSMLAERAAQG
jgi:uncharacterized protein (DUF305 family)